jgi:hypothetical protein
MGKSLSIIYKLQLRRGIIDLSACWDSYPLASSYDLFSSTHYHISQKATRQLKICSRLGKGSTISQSRPWPGIKLLFKIETLTVFLRALTSLADLQGSKSCLKCGDITRTRANRGYRVSCYHMQRREVTIET